MNRILKNPVFAGKITPPSSKSETHRLLIVAALSKTPAKVISRTLSDDILATINCLRAMGAGIEIHGDTIDITPLKIPEKPVLCDCGESASTLRFLLPVASALGIDCTFQMHGRLPERPMEPLEKVLAEHGAKIGRKDEFLSISGHISAGEYVIPGNISSQFISGLEFALPLLGEESTIRIEGQLESAPYVDMTEEALCKAKVDIISKNNRRIIPAGAEYDLRGTFTSESDWSAAAVWIGAAAIQNGRSITLSGMMGDSLQGDRQIVDIIRKMGADVRFENGNCTVTGRPLRAVDIDAVQIPDLVPVLSIAAAVADGITHIYNAKRLRNKESDRISAIYNMLQSLGADCEEQDDRLVIHGKKILRGGTVNTCSDHRIVMAAAVSAAVCEKEVDITDTESVKKSYPGFWDDLERLII